MTTLSVSIFHSSSSLALDYNPSLKILIVDIESIPRGDKTLDFSSVPLLSDGTTTYTWKYADGTVIPANLYTNDKGKFTFTGLAWGSNIYCEMTNTRFPGLTLRTTVTVIVSLVDSIVVDGVLYNANDWYKVQTAKASNGLKDDRTGHFPLHGSDNAGMRSQQLGRTGHIKQHGSVIFGLRCQPTDHARCWIRSRICDKQLICKRNVGFVHRHLGEVDRL